MPIYPDWLMKYKTKGVYVKKGKKGYSLYRGHSERVPGKKNPVFKCDEYIGIVTEKDGLIPSSPPVKPGIDVLRYGFWCLADNCCKTLLTSLKKRHMNVGVIYSRALLEEEGKISKVSFSGSWLSHLYPEIDIEKHLGHVQESTITRVKMQIRSKMETKYGNDYEIIKELASNVYAVHVNGKWFTSDIPEDLQVLAVKYGISFTINND